MTTDLIDTLETRVGRGSAWLDSICPSWREAIDLDKLDLSSAHSCILGQVFAERAALEGAVNGFSYVEFNFDDPEEKAEFFFTHGFDRADSMYGADPDWPELTEAWRVHLMDGAA